MSRETFGSPFGILMTTIGVAVGPDPPRHHGRLPGRRHLHGAYGSYRAAGTKLSHAPPWFPATA